MRLNPKYFHLLPSGCIIYLSPKSRLFITDRSGATAKCYPRLVYQAQHGKLHKRIPVRHWCGNKECCNLAHLYTPLDLIRLRNRK
jgi:hypothetical protein